MHCLSPLGFCRLTPHPRSPGTWTIYFEGADYESHLLQDNADLASTHFVGSMSISEQLVQYLKLLRAFIDKFVI